MDKIKARIAALLAKAERTDNDAEAQAYLAKAEDLMLRHAIERADLEAADTGREREQIVKMRVPYLTAPKGFYKHLGVIGSAIIVEAIKRVDMTFYAPTQVVFIFGPKTDAEYVATLLPRIWSAAYAGLLRSRKAEDWKDWPSDWKWDYDRGYLVGFCQGVAGNIEVRHAQVEIEHPGALALVDRTAEIREAMGNPKQSRPIRVPSDGMAQGRRDGRAHPLTAGELR